MATTTEKLVLGSQATLLSSELNSLANNGTVIGGAFNNTQGGGGGDGYTLCDVELVLAAPGGTLTANTGISLWFLSTQDGTNYEDGDNSTTPARLPDVTFPVRAVSGAQRIVRRTYLPAGNFKPLARNDGTGQTLGATGNTIKIRPVSRQAV